MGRARRARGRRRGTHPGARVGVDDVVETIAATGGHRRVGRRYRASSVTKSQ